MPRKKHQHLTPEEKKELKKQKRLEKKLRAAEKKRQVKRDHLGREVKYGQVSYRKYEKDWREMLIKVAAPRMRSELEFAWHNFERVVDCKDFTISLLMDEIRDSEEQYMLNFRAHSENMEQLMGIFKDRLNDLRKDFNIETKEMQERCDNEYKSIKEGSNENQDYLKTMLYQLELQKKEHIRLKRGEYFARLDEVEVKNQLLLQKLRAHLERKYQNMFEQMQQFFKNYNKQIKDRKKEHNMLKAQDDAIQELIAQQFKQIRKCQNTIRQLRQKYIDMKQTEGNNLLDVQDQRQYFSNSFLTLKIKLEQDKKSDFGKLARLSGSCAEAFEYLQGLNKKGEMILSLTAVCRKLETQKEKISPFHRSLMSKAVDNDRDDAEEIEGVRPEMELFWQRLGQAYGVHYSLAREKRFLTEENQLIVDTHNQYCEDLMFPPHTSYHKTVGLPKTDANAEMKKHALHRNYSFMFRK